MKKQLEYLILAIITFLLFSNTINHQYVYDDYPFIVNNRFVKQDFKGIPAIFSSSYWDGNENLHNVDHTNYQSIPAASFALEQALFSDNIFPKHIAQVLLYLVLVLLIYCLLKLSLNHKNKAFHFFGFLVILHTSFVQRNCGKFK